MDSTLRFDHHEAFRVERQLLPSHLVLYTHTRASDSWPCNSRRGWRMYLNIHKRELIMYVLIIWLIMLEKLNRFLERITYLPDLLITSESGDDDSFCSLDLPSFVPLVWGEYRAVQCCTSWGAPTTSSFVVLNVSIQRLRDRLGFALLIPVLISKASDALASKT